MSGLSVVQLDATAWVRIGAALFVLGAIGATALQVSRTPPAPTPPDAGSVAIAADPLSAELERCRRLTPDSPPDEACEQTWARVRQRFLGSPAAGGGARP